MHVDGVFAREAGRVVLSCDGGVQSSEYGFVFEAAEVVFNFDVGWDWRCFRGVGGGGGLEPGFGGVVAAAVFT
tara:strand:- start:392 stop:610 length:219 start_codon:yes stop_codon:yes gene_type:complete